ncbi:cytochrome C assembly protein [Anaerolineae bacterium CFX9]|nr:cytochrome C assembly protein [Anaerolineae bacterium CFX9]
MSAVRQMPITNDEFTPTDESAGRTRILYAVTVLAAISLIGSLIMALMYPGTDAAQGEVQRIFYIHVSAFAGAFIAYGVTVIAGILYLIRHDPKWDTLALAGVEVGTVLAVINLATGSVWARPIWNTWWTWDPRLTSAAIMVLTYFAYLFLRNAIENRETRARFASIYGILAYTSVIVTLIIIRIRPDTIHPAVIGPSPQNAQGGFELAERMITTMSVSMVVWSVFVPLALMWWRIRLENLADRVRARRAQVMEN